MSLTYLLFEIQPFTPAAKHDMVYLPDKGKRILWFVNSGMIVHIQNISAKVALRHCEKSSGVAYACMNHHVIQSCVCMCILRICFQSVLSFEHANVTVCTIML
jgi:hypothetical protein